MRALLAARWVVAVSALAAAAWALASCGGSAPVPPRTTATSAGARVFASAGCGNCHTLQAAGSSGTIGPNLDRLRPSRAQAAAQVRHGGGGMPSFATVLSPRQIAAVATYVARATHGGLSGSPFRSVEQLVARGADLYISDGCSGCHTTTGARGIGPTFDGLASHVVTLASGRRVRATAAYIRRSILAPDAQTVKGYPPRLMAEAVRHLHLPARPAEVEALTQFIVSIGRP